MSFAELIQAAEEFIGIAEKVGSVAEAAAPALKGSVTIAGINKGLQAMQSLPWTDMASAISSNFSNAQQDTVLLEDVLKALAPFIPVLGQVEGLAEFLPILIAMTKPTTVKPLNPDGTNPNAGGAPVFT